MGIKQPATLYFNATLIAKQFDKKPKDFLKIDSTKEYIQAMHEVNSQEDNSPLEIELVRVQHGGKYRGTWLHNDRDGLPANCDQVLRIAA